MNLNLSNYHFVVVYPKIHVSSADAYKHIVPRKPTKDIRDILKQPIETWRAELKNDFEKSVFQKHPKISKLKQEFYNSGATYASMSGSGSTVFGIFKDSPKANLKHLGEQWSFML